MRSSEPARHRNARSRSSTDAALPSTEAESTTWWQRAARRCGWRRPRASSAFWLLSTLTLGCALMLMRPPVRLPNVRPIEAPLCEVPVEVPGQGVLCLTAEKARLRGLAAGDVWPSAAAGEPAAGPPARMAPRRLLAAGVLLDPQTATAAELEALPEVGAELARRIIQTRQTRQQRDSNGEPPRWRKADLLQVPGLGERRLTRLLPFLIPLP